MHWPAKCTMLSDCGSPAGNPPDRDLEMPPLISPHGPARTQIHANWVVFFHEVARCGSIRAARLSLLTRRGFRGKIVATTATQELARLVILDDAHLQEEARSNSHRRRRGADDNLAEPLFAMSDALKSLESFGRSAVYRQPIDPARGIRATFVDAGRRLPCRSSPRDLAKRGSKCPPLTRASICSQAALSHLHWIK
jgi:hypothetical protein